MTRDLSALADREFDLLVVGAGIYGATIAWEAAHRGLSVALVDRGDFGGGTSFNSLKTIHGGLRSLQRANVREMRRFIVERRALMRIAPHLVRPLRFLIPTYGQPRRSRSVMRLVLALNDRVARDRNADIDPSRRLPPSSLVSREETLRLFEGLDESRVTGGASWYDGQMHHADRVLLAFVQSAVRSGTVAVNYVGATGFLRDDARVTGIAARDELTGATFDVRARLTVNAAGGWAPALSATLGAAVGGGARVTMSRAVNLVTRLPAPACALGDTAEGQFLFAVPWRGVTMFGTLHDDHAHAVDDLTVRAGEVEQFLRLVNRAFPAVQARLEDVTLVHRGFLPSDGVNPDGTVRLVKESVIRDYVADGVAGLITVIGVRYTTARSTAEQTVDAAAAALGREIGPSRSTVTPLSGGDIADVAEFLNEARRVSALAPADVRERLALTYGTAWSRVLALMEADQELVASIGEGCKVTGAEVAYAMREEQAVRLADVIQRRTDAGSAACPPRAALERCAQLMARLARQPARIASEIEDVEARYRIPQ